MRRKDREITEISKIQEIINSCMVCRIAMQDAQGLYIVPLNFGYEIVEDKLVLFFHSAKEGRKIDVISDGTAVAFEMDCEGKIKQADTACGYGYYFSSVMGTGEAEIVEEMEEKKRALTILMKHQTGKDFDFDEKMAQAVCVFKVTANEFTGKRSQKDK